MNKIKVFVKVFTKDGNEFATASSKGLYLPLGDTIDDVYYNIKLTKRGKVIEFPNVDGVYEIGYNNSKDIWLDKRPEQASKNIVRVNASKVVFVEPFGDKNIEEVTDDNIPF